MNTLSNIFGAVMQFFGFMSKRQDANNAPDVKAAKVGQTEATLKDETIQHLKTKDIKNLRNDLSE